MRTGIFLFLLLMHLLSSNFSIQAQVPIWKEVSLNNPNKITKIHVDTLGFLWMITNNDLVRYDGFEMTTFIKGTDAAAITDICPASDGKLRIGFSSGQITTFNPFNPFVLSDTITTKWPIDKLAQNQKGDQFVALSYGKGLFWQKGLKDSVISAPDLLVSNEVYDAVFIDNRLYLASDLGLQVLEWNDQLESIKHIGADHLLDAIITHIEVKDSSALYLSNFSERVIELDIHSLKTRAFEFSDNSKINGLFLSPTDELFASRQDGLYKLLKDQWVKKYPLNGNSAVFSVIQDEEQNLWLSAEKNKLVKGNQMFEVLHTSLKSIQAMTVIGNDFLLGTDEGLFLINRSGQSLKKLLNYNITSLYTNADGLVWVGTFSNGFLILNQDGIVLSQLDYWEQIENQSVLYILPTENEVYVSSLTGVTKWNYAHRKNKISLFKETSLNQSLGPGYIYHITSNHGKLYFGTDRQGLKILDKSDLTTIHKWEAEEIGSVYSVVHDQNNLVWFTSTRSGLGYIKNNEATIRTDIKNRNDHYTSLIPTPRNQILMIRSSSVDLLDPSRNHIVYFDKEIGISSETPYLNNYVMDGQGVIWFVHDNKLYSFRETENYKIHPEIILDGVSVNLEDINDQKRFSRSQNNFEFTYTGSWLTDPEKLSYQYLLEGFDEDWRSTKDRTISYPQLPPGNYTFKVRASENTAFSDEPEAHYSFTISRSFYSRPSFWLLVLVGALFLYLWYRQYKKNRLLIKSEMERKHVESQLTNLKNQLNPHFLFNSFNTLIGLIEEDSEKGVRFTEKLTDFYRLILEHGKSQLVTVAKELKLVNLYYQILKVRFDNALEVNFPNRNINSLIPPLTIQLLIENAVKHNELSKRKKLIVDISQDGEFICISNNINPKLSSGISSGQGLVNIKKRYLLLSNKSIIIEKNSQLFRVKLPILDKP